MSEPSVNDIEDVNKIESSVSQNQLLNSVITYNELPESSINSTEVNSLIEKSSFGPNISNLLVFDAYQQPLWFKLIVLFCVSFLSFGSYFASDATSALAIYIRDDLNIDGTQFASLGSIALFSGAPFVLVGGYITDRVGNRISMVVFCSIACLGAAIVSLGASIKSFETMLAGEFVFGLGSQASYVVRNNICIEWFEKWKYFALSMGLSLTVPRMGTIAVFSTEDWITEELGSYLWGLWIATFLCIASLLGGFLWLFLDMIAKRKFYGGRIFQDVKKSTSTSLLFANPFKFGWNYWLCLIISVTVYAALSPFLSLTNVYISAKWNISSQKANFLLSLIDTTSLILTPFLGFFVDFTGKRGWIIFFGNITGVFGYCLLGFTNFNPIIGSIIVGVHFAIVPAALWPTLPLLVDRKHSGFAFALVCASIAFVLIGVNPLFGYIGDLYGFEWLCIFCAAIASLSALTSFVWCIADVVSSNPFLNKKQRVKEN